MIAWSAIFNLVLFNTKIWFFCFWLWFSAASSNRQPFRETEQSHTRHPNWCSGVGTTVITGFVLQSCWSSALLVIIEPSLVFWTVVLGCSGMSHCMKSIATGSICLVPVKQTVNGMETRPISQNRIWPGHRELTDLSSPLWPFEELHVV